jgi:hypothetical protein
MATSCKKTFILLTFLCFLPPLTLSPLLPVVRNQSVESKALELLEIGKSKQKSTSYENKFFMLKSSALYLISKGDQINGLKKYKEYVSKTQSHDYKLLREICLMIIEDGIAKGTEQESLLSLIAMEIAGEDVFTHHLGKLLKSNFFPVQAKTLSLLKRIDNDYSDILIKSCLSSSFIMLRLEALSILVQKHNKTALGQVEALMNMVHKQYHPIFVDFYAMAGTKYAVTILKQMLSDGDLNLNLATIAACKNYKIEELIPNLRNCLTHTSSIVREAAADALGAFNDSIAIPKLEKMGLSNQTETKLAAWYALYCMGDKSKKEDIITLAKGGNLFAISLLSHIDGSEKCLHEIYYLDDNDLRINSGISLLEMKDPLCLPVIKDLITLDKDVYYINVTYSPGRAFQHLTVTPLSTVKHKEMIPRLIYQTLMIQNSLLAKTIDLPRNKFMEVMDEIFLKKRNSLIPTAISLLENFDDQKSLDYLMEKSKTLGAPFIRTSCHLSLWKSTKNPIHKEAIDSWLKEFGKHQMISFSQNTEKTNKKNSVTGYELTLEERSHLLIQCFLNICISHENAGLDSILEAMITGHEKNRIPLAGVVLKTIQ